MPKNNGSGSARKGDVMTGPMKFFLAGCVAELYLLIIRRFYTNGTLRQVVAWDGYLIVLGWIGVAAAAAGLVFALLRRQDRTQRFWGLCVLVGGVFVAAASFLTRLNWSVLTLLLVLVPVAVALGLAWGLYDRPCALSLTALGLSLVAAWVCRRAGYNLSYGIWIRAAVVVCIAALAAAVLLLRSGKLLPPKADRTQVYAACALSIAALAVSLINATAAHYAMWALAFITFGLVVYDTVKQL